MSQMDLGGAAAGEDRAAPSEGETEWALTYAEKAKRAVRKLKSIPF